MFPLLSAGWDGSLKAEGLGLSWASGRVAWALKSYRKVGLFSLNGPNVCSHLKGN